MGIGNLDRKVAIVTGGAQILGAAVVTALHEAGASVVIGDINARRGKVHTGHSPLYLRVTTTGCDLCRLARPHGGTP